MGLFFRPMIKEDYIAVRYLLKRVTRQKGILSEVELDDIFDKTRSSPLWNPIVGEDDCKVIAYGELLCFPHLAMEGGWEGRIERITVDEKEQGKGIGTDLTQHLLDLARTLNISKISLTVENPKAKHIYESKFGFQIKDTQTMELYPSHRDIANAVLEKSKM